MNVVLTYLHAWRAGQHKGLVPVSTGGSGEEQNFGRSRPEISAEVLGRLHHIRFGSNQPHALQGTVKFDRLEAM